MRWKKCHVASTRLLRSAQLLRSITVHVQICVGSPRVWHFWIRAYRVYFSPLHVNPRKSVYRADLVCFFFVFFSYLQFFFFLHLQAFQRQVQECLTQLELINKQYRRLARENRTDSSSRLKDMVHNGNKRWDNLQRRVAAILRRLKVKRVSRCRVQR